MKIRIIDGSDVPSPEDTAMLQALYSRSPASVDSHLEKVRKVGSGEFIKNYYIGYNHKSIGDCGSTTIFVENVSMLTAKAIQNWPLYRGQEASTRYMDFSKAETQNPLNSETGQGILDRWMGFYHSSQEELTQHIRDTRGIRRGEDPSLYDKAVRARVFDILRGWLPAGLSTNLSWHTDLRQAADHLAWLNVHPDVATRMCSLRIQEGLDYRYPSSRPRAISDEVAHWMRGVSELCEYRDETPALDFSLKVFTAESLHRYRGALETRPAHAPIPPVMNSCGEVQSEFYLDFGSFRDLQRHRNGTVTMPLLTTRHGFEPWYLDALPSSLKEIALRLNEQQEKAISGLPSDDVHKQYYIAMGYRVGCLVYQPIPAFIYRIETRTAHTVHPTLRAVAQKEAAAFQKYLPGVKVYTDPTPDLMSLRRGSQTITEKQ